MIAIICAMSEERDAFIKLMENVEVCKGQDLMYHGKPLDTTFYKGTIKNKECLVVHSGVGKVYSTLVTSMIINQFNPSLVINCGCAGSTDKDVHVGDVIIGRRVADWDVDVPGWSRNIDSEYVSNALDGEFIKLASKVNTKLSVKVGDIVSSDQFIYRKDQVDVIKEFFPSAKCGEMEGSSIAKTCYAYGVRVAIIRSISDETLVNGDYHNFDFNLSKACANSAKFTAKVIEKMM